MRAACQPYCAHCRLPNAPGYCHKGISSAVDTRTARTDGHVISEFRRPAAITDAVLICTDSRKLDLDYLELSMRTFTGRRDAGLQRRGHFWRRHLH